MDAKPKWSGSHRYRGWFTVTFWRDDRDPRRLLSVKLTNILRTFTTMKERLFFFLILCLIASAGAIVGNTTSVSHFSRLAQSNVSQLPQWSLPSIPTAFLAITAGPDLAHRRRTHPWCRSRYPFIVHSQPPLFTISGQLWTAALSRSHAPHLPIRYNAGRSLLNLHGQRKMALYDQLHCSERTTTRSRC